MENSKNFYDIRPSSLRDSVYNIPQIKKAFPGGKDQVVGYGKKLEGKYGKLRLKKFVVTSPGFERICYENIS